MVYYCFRRNRYLEIKSIGRNNTGRIMVRGKQKPLEENKSCLYKGFNYLFMRNIIRFFFFFNVLKLKIISRVVNENIKLAIYVAVIKNSMFKNCYIYLPISDKVTISDVLIAGEHGFLQNGNILVIQNVPVGNLVHNIYYNSSWYVRRSNKNSYIVFKGSNYVTVKLPSGSFKLINKNSLCIFGRLELLKVNKIRKAGENRHFGKRPKVRGVAMNACDHPHGGGEGKSYIGRKSIFSI